MSNYHMTSVLSSMLCTAIAETIRPEAQRLASERKYDDLDRLACGVSFRLSDHYPEDDDEPEVTGGRLDLLVHGRTRYLHVLYRVVGSDHDLPSDWTHVVCHDSCWRDGIREVIGKFTGDPCISSHIDQAGQMTRGARWFSPSFDSGIVYRLNLTDQGVEDLARIRKSR